MIAFETAHMHARSDAARGVTADPSGFQDPGAYTHYLKERASYARQFAREAEFLRKLPALCSHPLCTRAVSRAGAACAFHRP
jgi:hypothetical protein